MTLIPLILAFCMTTIAVADYPYVNWTYPTGPIRRDNASNLTVHIGDTVDAAWTSTWVEDHDHGPWIEMHCGPGNLLLHATQVPQNGTFPFSMTGLNLNGWGLPMSCQFSIGYDKAGNASAGFVLDEQTQAAAKTWRPTALAATATMAPGSSQTGEASAATTTTSPTALGKAPIATPSATPASGGEKGELSPGAAAGVGVGCTVVGLGLLGVSIWLIRRWKKRWAIAVIRRGDSGAKGKQEPDMNEAERTSSFAKPEMNADQTRYEMPEEHAMPKELEGRARHYELSGAERRRELEGG